MAGWSDFIKQDKKTEQVDFSPIKNELRKQEGWIRELHGYSRSLHGYASYLEESNTKHKKEIIEQISGLVKWIDYLNSSHATLKEEFKDLKQSIRGVLRSDLETYHRTLEEYLKLRFNQEQILRNELKAEIQEELKSLLKQEKPRPVINEDNAKPVNTIMHYNAEIELSNPEKELLNVLFNENKPMTYENIAKKTGKSVNTVRVYMNSLKVKKPIIEEFLAPSGSKIFSVKNSEIVKTLFNLKKV